MDISTRLLLTAKGGNGSVLPCTQIGRARLLMTREELLRRKAAGETDEDISQHLGVSARVLYLLKKELGVSTPMSQWRRREIPPEVVLATYKKTGTVRKTAKKLKKSGTYVSMVLKRLGIDTHAEAAINACASTLCTSCKFAYADRCSFMASDTDVAESILKAAGAQYVVERYSGRYQRGPNGEIMEELSKIKVTECPKYKKDKKGAAAR